MIVKFLELSGIPNGWEDIGGFFIGGDSPLNDRCVATIGVTTCPLNELVFWVIPDGDIGKSREIAKELEAVQQQILAEKGALPPLEMLHLIHERANIKGVELMAKNRLDIIGVIQEIEEIETKEDAQRPKVSKRVKRQVERASAGIIKAREKLNGRRNK